MGSSRLIFLVGVQKVVIGEICKIMCFKKMSIVMCIKNVYKNYFCFLFFFSVLRDMEFHSMEVAWIMTVIGKYLLVSKQTQIFSFCV